MTPDTFVTPDTFDRLERAVAAQLGRDLGACIAVSPGELAELLRLAHIGAQVESNPAAQPQTEE